MTLESLETLTLETSNWKLCELFWYQKQLVWFPLSSRGTVGYNPGLEGLIKQQLSFLYFMPTFFTHIKTKSIKQQQQKTLTLKISMYSKASCSDQFKHSGSFSATHNVCRNSTVFVNHSSKRSFRKNSLHVPEAFGCSSKFTKLR